MTWKTKEYISYQTSHMLNNVLTHLILRPRIMGQNNIPKTGRVIVAPTHRSMVDIPVAGCLTWRAMRWMVKKELVSNKFSKFYFETCGSFGVDKDSSDPAAVKKALKALNGEDKLLVFPEGRRNKLENVGELLGGVGFLAAKTNSPIVPVAMYGVDKPFYLKNYIPHKRKIFVLIGEPITFHIGREGKTSVIAREIQEELTKRLFDLYEKCKTF